MAIPIVIPLHKSGGKLRDNSELRFVLRSLERHFKGDYQVTIIGERIPEWIQGIHHIKRSGGLKSALKTAAAEYPDGFFWWYDDVVLLRDATIEDLKISFAKPGLRGGATGWGSSVAKVAKRLVAEGIEPWDYSHPHGPYWFDKSMVDEGFEDWPGMKGKFPWESWILSKRKWPSRRGPFKQYYGAFKGPPADGCWYVNFNDHGFTVDLRKWLYSRFPERCDMEVSVGTWTSGATKGSKKFLIENDGKRVKKIEVAPDKKRRNDIFEEAAIILDLNRKGCPCVPRLLEYGTDDEGRRYIVTECIQGTGDPPRAEDVFLSYLAVRGCGWEHGDIMPANVIFDGKIAWMVDFDRAYPAEDFIDWGTVEEGKIDPGMNIAFGKLKESGLDLAKTSLGRNRNIYHSISSIVGDIEITAKGERGIGARAEILKNAHLEGERVLDVGCNTGAVSRFVKVACRANWVDGVEFNAKDAVLGQMVTSAEGIQGVRIRQGSIGEGSYISGNYDTAILFSVVHHLLNPHAVGLEISQCCQRLLIEAKPNESGHWYGGKGNTFRLPPWKFKDWKALHLHLESLFPGFGFVADLGATDRGRRIMEFRRNQDVG